jgi:ATPase subunit of ABC transporter with duplicated ATPase domains
MQLTATNITHSHGSPLVLDRVSLTIAPGDRIGLVGPNGVGKSTLLRVLSGELEATSGTVIRSPATMNVGHLPQEVDARPGETLHELIERRTGVAAAERAMDDLAARLGGEPDLAGAYSEALERYLALGGADLAARAGATAAELGVPDDGLERPMESLSGGERARAALAATLLSRFDVLLLDEPTNDLDVDGIDLLDRFISESPAGIVMVTHDRSLLERHADRVVELDEFTRRATEYRGGWEAYQRERERARRGEWDAWERYEDEKGRLQQQLVRRREWARQGAHRARTRQTDNAKSLWDARAEAAENLGAGAGAIERRIGRLERAEKPREPWRLSIGLTSAKRAGDVVARLEGAVVERDRFTLGPIDLDIGWQDRVAVTGRNGSGKSTLIGALLGTVPLARGRRTIGPSVVPGSMDQARTALPGARALVDAFTSGTAISPQDARSLLAKFGLEADDVERPVEELSPGERSRAELALLTARGTNFLILDEPTNHLDLAAIEPLEQALAGYDGTLLVVSHDRRFLERIALTRTFDLPR